MLNDIYNQRILELAGNIPRQGRLAAPQASAKAHSKLCGSTIIVDLAMDGGKVVDFAHDVKACALGQAAASIMARHVIGATAPELRSLRDRVRAMLKDNGPPPDGAWADLAVLEPVRDYKARHASTLLTFEATVDAIDQIEAARSSPNRYITGDRALLNFAANSDEMHADFAAVGMSGCDRSTGLPQERARARLRRVPRDD